MKNKRTRIAFWGNFGTGNWGNECTLQAIVHNARRVAPEAELLCICSEPDDTEKRHGIPAFPISYLRRSGAAGSGRHLPRALRVLRRAAAEAREWGKTLSIARKLDAIVMTGTGMLTDDSEGAFGLPYDLFKWAVAARVCGGRVVFASVGVEPISSGPAKFFITSALRLAEYRSYRDLQSKERLQKAGFDDARDEVYPDLAFSLPSAADAKPAPAEREGAAREGRIVAVGIYAYRARGAAGDDDARAYRDYLDKIGSFIAWLLDHGYRVRVIIGDLTYDEAVLHDLRAVLDSKKIPRDTGRVEDAPAASVDEIMRQISAVDVVVASRFHNVLLALFLGKPVVSVSYNEKNDALMTAVGLEKYCQSIDDFDLRRLTEQITDIEANWGRLRSTIMTRGAAFRDDLEQQYRRIFGGDA